MSLGLVGMVALNIGPLVRASMTPGGAFDAEVPPPAPDYTLAASWSALPDRDDAGDPTPTGEAPIDQRLAPADVFYVHPTSYVGSRWNAGTDDPTLNEATDRVATGIQATAFNGCCAVYAPRYRQANGTAFLKQSDDGDRARDLSFVDITRAFEAFNARRGPDRPFILAAHSQGAALAQRLLEEVISGSPLRDQLVAAWLIGGPVTLEGLRERAPDIPVCQTPTDTHCVIAWNARGEGFQASDFEMFRTDMRERVCTNPLTWRTDGAPAPAAANLGAVFLETDDRALRPGFADAQCVDGTLVIRHIGAAPRDLPSRVLDHVLGAGNFHPIEYQIYFANIRENAKGRVAGFLGG
ncbi:MAG: DUF3089 domain-containing protein [Myxococcota bacterium]